jgi:hypothetical protein
MNFFFSKLRVSLYCFAMAALLVLSPIAFFSSCKGGPDVTAYKISKGSRVTVEAAMGAWNDYVKQFHPPVSEELRVQAAFDKYRTSQVMLLDAAIAYKTSQVATNAAGQLEASRVLQAATQAAAAAKGDLIALLESFNVKL